MLIVGKLAHIYRYSMFIMISLKTWFSRNLSTLHGDVVDIVSLNLNRFMQMALAMMLMLVVMMMTVTFVGLGLVMLVVFLLFGVRFNHENFSVASLLDGSRFFCFSFLSPRMAQILMLVNDVQGLIHIIGEGERAWGEGIPDTLILECVVVEALLTGTMIVGVFFFETEIAIKGNVAVESFHAHPLDKIQDVDQVLGVHVPTFHQYDVHEHV